MQAISSVTAAGVLLLLQLECYCSRSVTAAGVLQQQECYCTALHDRMLPCKPTKLVLSSGGAAFWGCSRTSSTDAEGQRVSSRRNTWRRCISLSKLEISLSRSMLWSNQSSSAAPIASRGSSRAPIAAPISALFFSCFEKIRFTVSNQSIRHSRCNQSIRHSRCHQLIRHSSH